MNSKKSPIIGITVDWRETGQYSLYPWYVLRQNYTDCVALEGGLPIMLPFLSDRIDEYINHIDGLLISGGDFDIHPSLYGEDIQHHRVTTIDNRTKFEYKLIQESLRLDIPILGICGGAQLLNVVLGGSLIQHIEDEGSHTVVTHEQSFPYTKPIHEAEIKENTILHSIIKQSKIPVNSSHHQAVKGLGKGLVINAIAPDGIVEGIEAPDYKFCMGVQWHPEYNVSQADQQIFKAFVTACQTDAKK